MWGCHWWRRLLPTSLQKQPNRSPLLATQHQNDAVCPNRISFSSAAGMLATWLNRRPRRYLILILCSPLLIPLFCATCPFICAMEVCSLICRRRRAEDDGGEVRRAKDDGGEVRRAEDDGGEVRRTEDDGGEVRRTAEEEDEVGLLQRYLQDQLMLVVGSLYECGDDDENMRKIDGADVQYFDSARPRLQ